MGFQRIVKSMFNRFGYNLSRLPPPGQTAWNRLGYHLTPLGVAGQKEPFHDQAVLLAKLPGDPPVTTVIDVGADVGDVAGRYRGLFPQATVYCFEPFEGSYKTLAARFAGDSSVRPTRAAVTDRAGTVRFYQNQTSQTNSVLAVAALAHSGMVPQGVAEVESVTLDDFCRAQTIQRVNILKLDIQGGELLALRGAKDLLSAGRIDLIYSEVLFAPHYQNQANCHDVSLFLAQHGYSLFGLYSFYQGPNGALLQADAIYLSGELGKAVG